MNTLVVARYNESVEWMSQVSRDFNIHIYNKGDELNPESIGRSNIVVQSRPNIGRESETYLYHLLSNVDNGDGFTVFSQGDPFSHSPDFIGLMTCWRRWDSIQPLSAFYLPKENKPPPDLQRSQENRSLGTFVIRPEIFSLYTWDPLFFYDNGTINIKRDYLRNHGLSDGTNIAAHFLTLCNLQIAGELASRHAAGAFSYGAIFAVRNDLIRRLSRASVNLMRNYSIEHSVYGYIFERLWLHIFGLNFALPLEGVYPPMTKTPEDPCFLSS